MAIIFGQYTGGTYWKPHPFKGQSGWFELPLNFFCRSANSGNIEASPNCDFTGEVYQVQTDYDGTMVIQNLLVYSAQNPPPQLRI